MRAHIKNTNPKTPLQSTREAWWIGYKQIALSVQLQLQKPSFQVNIIKKEDLINKLKHI